MTRTATSPRFAMRSLDINAASSGLAKGRTVVLRRSRRSLPVAVLMNGGLVSLDNSGGDEIGEGVFVDAEEVVEH